MKSTKYLSRLFSLSVCLAMLLSMLPMQPVNAISSDIVISQVYGGGGNSGATYTHDFIELFNRGDSSISLNGWSLQYASATGTGLFGSSYTMITELPDVSLAPGQYFLVQEAKGAGGLTSLPTPDLIDPTPINMSGTGAKVALVNTQTSLGCNGGLTPCSAEQLALIIDLVGWGTADFYETAAAPGTTNATAVFRNGNGCSETDNNSTDFSTGAPTPRNTASPLYPCGDAAPIVTSTTPANGATQVALTSNLEILFSEAVDVTGDWFNLTCVTSGEHTAVVSGGQTTFTLDPTTDFATGESCTLTVNAASVNDQDSNDPPDYMAADFSASFTAYVDLCTLDYTPIYNIQGNGMTAATTGLVTTQGVVVGDFETSASLSGFYMQDLIGDSDTTTSDGIFVYTGNNNFVSTGQVVRVMGYARERFNQTTLNGSDSNDSAVLAANIINCGSDSVTPVDVNMPFESPSTPERYEGMLVRFPQALEIAEYINYDRYGEIGLGLPLDGQERLYTPTSVVEPGGPAINLAYENSLRRIMLDDVQSAQNPATLRHPNGLPFSLTNLFRGGDLVQNATGVLGYDFNLYRIIPTGSADFTVANPRPPQPEEVGGRLQIAAMNTLNYFLTLDYQASDPLDNKCGPDLNMECRGADADQPDEFIHQRTKLLAALSGLNAAVIGLNEMENTTGVEPLVDIVASLNAMLGEGTYSYINTGVIGTDAIKVGLIYKPGLVTPVGDFKLLTTEVDPRFLDDYNRPTLAQTFKENSTGARFTVAVNHLKSKGSDCNAIGDPDTGDWQGNCNLTRYAAALALVDWLANDPTSSGDPDFIIMGDLNSYAMEDPIDAILAGPDDLLGTADDYTNLISQFQGLYAYSYVFDGQNGYLDHALANIGMAGQITDVAVWHINADEADVLDYDTSFKPLSQDALYEPNSYRSSDHNTVLVGLDLLNLPPTVEKRVAVPGTLNLGDVVTYTLSLSNTGEMVTLNLAMTDTLPAGITFGGWLKQNGALESNGVITWGGNLSGQREFVFTAILDDDPTGYGQTITNTVEFTSTNAGSGSASAAFTVGTPVLSIAKTIETMHDPALPGDPITYTIGVRNDGTTDAISVHIWDVLPDDVIGNDLNITVTISAGSAFTITIPATLVINVMRGSTITNTTYYENGELTGNDSASFSVAGFNKIYLPLIMKH